MFPSPCVSVCSLSVAISLFHSLTQSLSLTFTHSLTFARALCLARSHSLLPPSLTLSLLSLSTSGFLLLRTSYPYNTKNGQVMEGGVDGVVVALGGRTTEVGTSMLTDGTRNIIEAMKVCGRIYCYNYV